jgi:hypothetical protein
MKSWENLFKEVFQANDGYILSAGVFPEKVDELCLPNPKNTCYINVVLHTLRVLFGNEAPTIKVGYQEDYVKSFLVHLPKVHQSEGNNFPDPESMDKDYLQSVWDAFYSVWDPQDALSSFMTSWFGYDGLGLESSPEGFRYFLFVFQLILLTVL